MLSYSNYFPSGALTDTIRYRLPRLIHYNHEGFDLVLRKAKQSAKFTSLLGVSGYKMLSNYMCSLHVALTSEPSVLEHTVTVVNCPLFCQKQYRQGKSTVGECQRNLT
jgi:hypothetical protein